MLLVNHGLLGKHAILVVKIGAILAGKALPVVSGSNFKAGAVKAALKVAVFLNLSIFAVEETEIS